MNNPFALLVEPEVVLAELSELPKFPGRVFSQMPPHIPRMPKNSGAEIVKPLLKQGLMSEVGRARRNRVWGEQFEIDGIGSTSFEDFAPYCSGTGVKEGVIQIKKGLSLLRKKKKLPFYWARTLWCLKHQPESLARALEMVNAGKEIPSTKELLRLNGLNKSELAHLLSIDVRTASLWLKRDGDCLYSVVKHPRQAFILRTLLSFGEEETIKQLLLLNRLWRYRYFYNPILQEKMEERYELS